MIELFSRYIKDSRNNFLIYAVITAVLTLWIVYVYPTIGKLKELDSLIETLPIFIQAMLGKEVLSYTTFEGFMAIEFYNTTLLWILAVFASLSCANIISSDISTKRMDILLANPIKRHQIILARFLTFIVYLFLLQITAYIIIFLGVKFVKIETDLILPIKIIIATFPISLAIGSICLFLSCLINEHIKAVSLSLGVVLLFFFLNIILSLSEKMSFLKKFIIFNYFDASKIVKYNTIDLTDMAILLAVSIVFLTISIIYFNKKEIYV